MSAKTILLADDDADDAEIFKEALEKSCPNTLLTRVENGKEVFDYLGHQKDTYPDIIFLDLNMPEMNGWQCLAKLKNSDAHADIPVVMYTTSSNPRDKQIAHDLSAHGLIVKPSNPKILEKVLETIVCRLDTRDLKMAINDAFLLSREF